jgi:hypothetical protein
MNYYREMMNYSLGDGQDYFKIAIIKEECS